MSNIILDAFYSLGRNINKMKGSSDSDTAQGIVGMKMPELELKMDNEDIIKLTEKWEKKWNESDVKAQFEKKGDEAENYWMGKQFVRPELNKTRANVDNVIFESLETYLPQITRRNPDPMVTLNTKEEQTPQNLQFAHDLQITLGDIADKTHLRMKLKGAGRHWAIYLLGAIKMGWDMNQDIPTSKVIRPRKLILDSDATITEDGYTGLYIGEHRNMSGGMLIDTLEAIQGEKEGIDSVKELVEKNLGTEIGFIEWWTDEYTCWTLGKKVLMKKRNPHWNYDQEVPMEQPAMPQMGAPGIPAAPQEGQEANGENAPTPEVPTQTVPGINHFKVPAKPYLLLSVFNLGKQPVDDTSLITQNLASQDRINKRVKQIDKNADSMNGSIAVSLERSGLTQQQAKGVTQAIRDGGTIAIATGSVQDAIGRISATGLPADVYNDLQDTRNRVKDIFGTRGSTPSGTETEKTVRGKIQNRVLDTDRIGGGVSEYLEQMGDKMYNWSIQLLYVYDDNYSKPTPRPKVNATVKEGSLLPKDSTTIANQAIQLTEAGKMAIIDLYKRLDYPNPEELAANVWLEANAPELLFANDPRIAQAVQMKQQAAAAAAKGAEKPPSESISFKDLPPDGQAQMASKVGIILHPEAIAAHDELLHKRSQEGSMPANDKKAEIPQK